MSVDFQDEEVARIFANYQKPIQQRLLELRELILDVAKKTNGVGKLTETLKWGQPSYLTSETKSGTTIRIDKDNKFDRDYALYVNCKTSLIEHWREIYPELKYDKTRSVHFSANQPLPIAKIRHIIAMALTYHINK